MWRSEDNSPELFHSPFESRANSHRQSWPQVSFPAEHLAGLCGFSSYVSITLGFKKFLFTKPTAGLCQLSGVVNLCIIYSRIKARTPGAGGSQDREKNVSAVGRTLPMAQCKMLLKICMYVCENICLHMCGSTLKRPEESFSSPRGELNSGCESPNVSAGN